MKISITYDLYNERERWMYQGALRIEEICKIICEGRDYIDDLKTHQYNQNNHVLVREALQRVRAHLDGSTRCDEYRDFFEIISKLGEKAS